MTTSSESSSYDLTLLEKVTNSALLCYGLHEGSLTDRRQEVATCLVGLVSDFVLPNINGRGSNHNNGSSGNNSTATTPRPSSNTNSSSNNNNNSAKTVSAATTNLNLPTMLLDDESVVREISNHTGPIRKLLSTVLMCEEARSIFRKEPHSFLRGPTLASAVIDRYFTVHLKSRLCDLVEPLVHQIFAIEILPEELPSYSTLAKIEEKERKQSEDKCVRKVRQEIIYAMRTLMRIIDTCNWPDGLRLALGDLQDFMVVARYYDEQGGGEAKAIRTGESEKDFSSRLASIVALHMLSPLIFSPWSMTLASNPSALQFAVTDDSHTPVKYYNEDQKNRLRKRLQTFYESHFPEGLANVEKALVMAVTEHAMFEKICAKYKVDRGAERQSAKDNSTLPAWLLSSMANNNNNSNVFNDEFIVTPQQNSTSTVLFPPPTGGQQTANNSVVPSANASPNPTSNRDVIPPLAIPEIKITMKQSPSTSNVDSMNNNGAGEKEGDALTGMMMSDPVQQALDQDVVDHENNSNNNNNVNKKPILNFDPNFDEFSDDDDNESNNNNNKSKMSTNDPTLEVNKSTTVTSAGILQPVPLSSNLLSPGGNNAVSATNQNNNNNNHESTAVRSRENSMLNHAATAGTAPSPAPTASAPTPEEMTKRRRRLALFVKILQKAANNSTFDIPAAMSNDPAMLALPLASTDPHFLCKFNDSLKNEFGQELRRSLRSIPVHWNDYVTSDGVDNVVITGGLQQSSLLIQQQQTLERRPSFISSSNNNNNNNNNNTNSSSNSPASGATPTATHLQSTNNTLVSIHNTAATTSNGGGSQPALSRRSSLTRKAKSFRDSTNPLRRLKCETRLRGLLQEDLCQAITAIQGLLPQFPYFEERYRSRLELWNLPLAIPALPPNEIDAMNPFSSPSSNDTAHAPALPLGAAGDDVSVNLDDVSEINLMGNLNLVGHVNNNKNNNNNPPTTLDEGKRALASPATNPEYFLVTHFPIEHPCHALNQSKENLRPLHADLLQIIRFHPPHVFVIHGELLVKLENKIKSDGTFLPLESSSPNSPPNSVPNAATTRQSQQQQQQSASAAATPKSIAISIPDCEKAIEAHFSARLEIVATKRNRKTGIAVIFLTPPQSAGKWGSHWFSKHVLKVLPSTLIENISRYIVVKPTFMARTKAWKNAGSGTEDAQMIDSAMCMVDRLDDVHPLLFAPKDNNSNIFSGGPGPGSPIFGAGGTGMLQTPNGTNQHGSVVVSPSSPSMFSATSASTTTTASPASMSSTTANSVSATTSSANNNNNNGNNAPNSAPVGQQTVWLTLPPHLMPEYERSADAAAAVVRLYRGSLTILEILRLVPRQSIASYLLDRSGMAGSPAGGSSVFHPNFNMAHNNNATASPTPTKGDLLVPGIGSPALGTGNASMNSNNNNIHTPLSVNLQNYIADTKSTSEMAKRLKEQWVCTAARCSAHLEYFDQTPSAIQSLGSVLFDIVLDRFFVSAFGCFTKEALMKMAELFFCVDGNLKENNNNNNANGASSSSSANLGKQQQQQQTPANTNPAERVPASSIVFRGVPTGLMHQTANNAGTLDPNNLREASPLSPLRIPGLFSGGRGGCGSDGSTSSDAMALWAAPGGVQRVMKFVRESLLVYPYRGGMNTNSTLGGGGGGGGVGDGTAPPLNSMQASVILALAESIIPHSTASTLGSLNPNAFGASGTYSDVISLIHNVLFSPRDAMDRIIREVVYPLLSSVFYTSDTLLQSSFSPSRTTVLNKNIPDAHAESLRMATEAFTRCIATAVARASISAKNHGPASDWLELAIACALPRIAIDRRRASEKATATNTTSTNNNTANVFPASLNSGNNNNNTNAPPVLV